MAQLRIGEETRQALRDIARSEGESMQSVLDKAVAEYQKKRFFERLDLAFGTLRSDPEAWREEQGERQIWANTLSDDLGSDEVWTVDGNVIACG
jgi:hypothetical protein